MNRLNAAIATFLLGMVVSLPTREQINLPVQEYPVLAIGKTKHGTVADGRTPTCTSCHGESPTHANKPADAVARPKPDRMFGRNSPTPVAERDGTCLTCHQGGKRIHWQLSAHAGQEVGCSSCHQVHAAHDKARDKLTQT